MAKVKKGASTLKIAIWTKKKVYEINSTVGDPNSDVLRVSTTKSLGQPTGTFTIEFVPKRDGEGKTWVDKLNAFDYVEIYMTGIDDDAEKIIMRGLIDNVGKTENFQSGIPQRTISVSGRDLGCLLSDFSVYYIPELKPVEAILKVLSWDRGELPCPVNAQEAFDFIFSRFSRTVELYVGKSMAEVEKVVTSAAPEDYYHRHGGGTYGATQNLSWRIKNKALSFVPQMKTHLFHLMKFEGSFWNAFQEYQDKPFHEMFIFETEKYSLFVLRPAALKDMRGNFPRQVVNAMATDQYKEMYPLPDGWEIEDADIISKDVRLDVSQCYNYFITVPTLMPMPKFSWRSAITRGLESADDVKKSINPFFAVEKEGEDEVLSYVGRYGFRKMEVTSNFIDMEEGVLKKLVEKEYPPEKTTEAPITQGKDKKKKEKKLPASMGKWDELINKYSRQYNVDKKYAYALMNTAGSIFDIPGSQGAQVYTSGRWIPYNSGGVDHFTNDYGVMGQPRETYDQWPNPGDWLPFDEGVTKNGETAIMRGCERLGKLKEAFNGDMDKAMMAYRFGKKAIEDYGIDGLPEQLAPPNRYDPKGWKQRYQRNVEDLDKMIEQWEKDNFDIDKSTYTPPPDPSTTVGTGDPVTDSVSRFARTAEMMNRTLVAWFLHNPFLYSGTIAIRGTNEAIIGTYVEEVDDMMSYYVEEVQHDFRVFESYTTTLGVTRGQFSGEGSFDSRPAQYGGPLKGKFYFDDAMQWRPEELEGEPTAATPSTSTTTGREQPAQADKGFIPLPVNPCKDGYYFYGERGKGGFGGWYYGTPQTINALIAAGAEWNRRYPNGPKIGIGDISDEYGNPLVNPKTGKLDHSAHRLGHEVDIRPMRKDKSASPVIWQHTDEYDRALTKEMLEVLRTNGVSNVHVVLFNDSEPDGSQAISGTKQYAKHDNHLHIRFA